MARRKVVDHLNAVGLVDTARAVLAAPPSVLPAFMAGMDIDPAVLGDVPMPGRGGADATALIEQATSERAQQHQRSQAQARQHLRSQSDGRAQAPRVHAAATRLAQALTRNRGASRPAVKPAADVPNCRTNIAVIAEWEDRAEQVFAAGGSKAQCRVACAEAEMLCKGCPLMESCAQEAKASHYTGVAGGRIFINGRNRLTPSAPTTIVA